MCVCLEILWGQAAWCQSTESTLLPQSDALKEAGAEHTDDHATHVHAHVHTIQASYTLVSKQTSFNPYPYAWWWGMDPYKGPHRASREELNSCLNHSETTIQNTPNTPKQSQSTCMHHLNTLQWRVVIILYYLCCLICLVSLVSVYLCRLCWVVLLSSFSSGAVGCSRTHWPIHPTPTHG